MSEPVSTREALLDAAEELFAERGYAAVGIREIAAEAGVNLAAINYHFGSKRDLYLCTVRHAMERNEIPWGMLGEQPASRAAAARQLVGFIRIFLGRVLDRRDLNTCGRLMLLEALRPSEALEAVVEGFTRPNEELLIRVLSTIAPRLERREALAGARSVLGQILHYAIFRPFVELHSDVDLSEPATVREIADHVARFSLKGLGCSEAVIARALKDASGPRPPSLTEEEARP